MEYPVCVLNANSTINNPKVLNQQRLDPYIYISIPDYISQNCALVDVAEVMPTHVKVEDYGDYIQPCETYPWIRVKSDRLNLSVGMHVYSLDYADPVSNAVFSLYFAYILQTDEPEKPYDYMEKYRNPES